jgi:hypothetical protein
MPVMMPWAMRVGSVRIASGASWVIHSLWWTVTSMRSAEATQTRACVRKPAGRPWKLRSRPISAPMRSASAMRANVTAFSVPTKERNLSVVAPM